MGCFQRLTNQIKIMNGAFNKSNNIYQLSKFLHIILLPTLSLISPLNANALDFFKYLNSENEKTIEFVGRNYYIIEDTPYCKNEENLLGYVLPLQDLYVICTKRIVRSSTTRVEASNLINETVTHENVHALQLCTPNDILGYDIPDHIVDKVNSMNSYKDLEPDIIQQEYEAFHLEHFPNIVRQESEEIDESFCYNQYLKY